MGSETWPFALVQVDIQPGDTVIDVGANIGLFSMYAAEKVGSSGRVIALEPIPQVHAACADNVKRHSSWALQQQGSSSAPCTVLNTAAGDGSQEEAVFTVYSK